jgi:hypothetical protein
MGMQMGLDCIGIKGLNLDAEVIHIESVFARRPTTFFTKRCIDIDQINQRPPGA